MDAKLYDELKLYIEKRFLPPLPATPSEPHAAPSAPKGKRGLFRFPSLSKKSGAEKASVQESASDYQKSGSQNAVPVVLHEDSSVFLDEEAPLMSYGAAAPISELEERLKYVDESFAEMLFRKIDESGMTDADCYHKAQLTRGHFNKIKNQAGYRPGKSTVLALILALGLNRKEADEMLAKAGYALSPSSRRDLIIEFCMEKGIYDIMQVNEYLLAFDQELLGAQ